MTPATTVPQPAELVLLPTPDEDDLRATVRRLLESRCPPGQVLASYDGDTTLRDALWSALHDELGLTSLLVPEELGGAGGTARDAAVVLGELGRAAAPVPFLTSAVVATTAAVRTGDADLLAELTSGAVAALLVPQTASASSLRPTVVRREGRLHGSVPVVAGVMEAAVLLVPVLDGDTVDLHLVVADADGVDRAPVVSLDMTRPVADVTLDGVASRLLLADAGDAVRHALTVGSALVASEQVGVAQWCLADTVDYLRDRRQFGRVLAGYQALKHRLADLFIQVDAADAAAQYAAAALAADDADVPVATAVARVVCTAAAVDAAEECVQLHGGIGMTWEHPAHLYLKRAKASQLTLGLPGDHLADLARLVDLAPA